MSRIFLCALFSLSAASVSRHVINRNATSSENKIGYNDIVSATISILFLCRPEDAEPTLLLGGEYNKFLRRAFFNFIPVTLIAESRPQFNALAQFTLTRYSFIIYQNYMLIRYIRKAHRFVMVASSQPMLRSILQRTKDSPWANSYGFYILIDRRTESRGCINARSYLWTAWEYDLLSVIFLCIDPEDGIVCYTFNPYSNDTPASWQEVGRAKGRNGHPWIIFKRVYILGKEMCTDLDFDKTTTLNGYEIRLNALQVEPYLNINLNASDLEKFSGDNSEIIKILLLRLGASLSIEIYNGTIYDLGTIGPNGTLEDMLGAVSDGRVDMGMNTRSLLVLWKVRYTYPHMRSGFCVITQSSEEVSEFVKLVTFMPWLAIVIIFLVCLLTYGILARKEGYGNAWVQIIRLVVCTGILHPPKINSTRIFICMTLILLLNVNAMIQSHLSSLLTIPVFYRNIDTMDDLKKSGYTVYGPSSWRQMITEPEVKKRYVSASYDACKEHVQNSTTAACMENCLHAYYRIKDVDLHRSRMLRSNGLIYRSRSLTFLSVVGAHYRKEKKKKTFKVMLLKQLAFCFCFLGIGYTCATIVFMVELLIGRSAPRSQNRRGIVKCKMKKTEEAKANNKSRMILAWK
ncbi:uncharacterized protein LOC105284159 isoform X2 [Ooceraea biroi]|uniref:uncharacterized protein LOC105284159 isoform X2 n=1 Tax=Ooceraea biroi TaxID=2015173 RepID=UPI0005B9E390|nr:uncharacterized protein LOC105284159 isoform X2 [Ooceraea biroi]